MGNIELKNFEDEYMVKVKGGRYVPSFANEEKEVFNKIKSFIENGEKKYNFEKQLEEIKSNYNLEKSERYNFILDKIIEEDEPKNTKNVIQIAILSILAAPLAIPLALVVAILVFVFFFLIGVFAFVLAIGSFAFFVFGISSIWDSLTISLGVSIPSFLLTIGISLLGFGLSAFCALGVSPLIQFTKNNFIKLAKRLSKKGARHA